MQKSGEKGKKKTDKGLLYCTNAPSAEYTRAYVEDAPCDNGRQGYFNLAEQEDKDGEES